MSLWGHVIPKPQQWYNKSQEYLKPQSVQFYPNLGVDFPLSVWVVRIKHHQDRCFICLEPLWRPEVQGHDGQVGSLWYTLHSLQSATFLLCAYKAFPSGLFPASFGDTRLMGLNMPVWLHLAHPKSLLSKQSHGAGVGLPYMNLKRHSAISFLIILKTFITYLFTEQQPDSRCRGLRRLPI